MRLTFLRLIIIKQILVDVIKLTCFEYFLGFSYPFLVGTKTVIGAKNVEDI